MNEWAEIRGFEQYECSRNGDVRKKGGRLLKVQKRKSSGTRSHRIVLQNPVCGAVTTTPQRVVYATFVAEIPEDFRVELINKDGKANIDNIKLVRRRANHDVEREDYCGTMNDMLKMKW